MQNDPLIADAADAAEAWGGLAHAPRLISHRENAVFDITLLSGQRGALRLHRAGYQTAEAIRSELLWCESLADAGFACPWPLRTENSALIHDPGPTAPVATVTLWLNAKPISQPGQPFAREAGNITAFYYKLGELLADLHLTSDAVTPEDLARPAWDTDALCSAESPIWGRFWENPALSADESALLCTARDAARSRLMARGHDGYGLIHADVLEQNVLVDGNQLYLIDFDDGGPGYRPYDLATALVQYVDKPNYQAICDALVAGYRDGGGSFSDADMVDLPMFVMLRAMASAGWIMSRSGPDDPRRKIYANRAVLCAQGFLEA